VYCSSTTITQTGNRLGTGAVGNGILMQGLPALVGTSTTRRKFIRRVLLQQQQCITSWAHPNELCTVNVASVTVIVNQTSVAPDCLIHSTICNGNNTTLTQTGSLGRSELEMVSDAVSLFWLELVLLQMLVILVLFPNDILFACASTTGAPHQPQPKRLSKI
jgi:hypothetical protein